MKKVLSIYIVWWIIGTACSQGQVYNIWTNGRVRYWLPKLDAQGNWVTCVEQ